MTTPQTNAQRQAKYKAKLARAGITEVRAILAHKDDHAAIRAPAKVHAARLARLRALKESKT